MSEKLPNKRNTIYRFRWLIGLLGSVLFVTGQLQLSSDGFHFNQPNVIGAWLTRDIHLGVPSLDNVLYGLPLLLLGTAFLAYAMRGLRLLPAEKKFDLELSVALKHLLPLSPWFVIGFVAFVILIWRIGDSSFQIYQGPIWLAGLISFAIATAIWDKKRGSNLSPRISRTDLLWITGIALVGLVIGTFRLQGLPDQLMGDEGRFWDIARDIARGDFKPSIFAAGVYTFPVFSSIFPAWFIKIFGISLWGWRLSSVLIGLLTIPPLYLLARDAFNHKIAVVSSVLLITSPYFLVFSRLGYNNIQALFITTASLYFLFSGLQRKSYLYYYLAGCSAGLGFYVYFGARFSFVIALAFIIFVCLTRKIRFSEAGLASGLLAFGLAAVITPHIIYGMQSNAPTLSFKVWESVFFNSFNGQLFYSEEELYAFAPPIEINNNVLFYHPKIYFEMILRGFLRTMLAFQKPWLISEHYIAFPLAGTVGVLFYLIGLTLTIWNFRKSQNALLLLWFFAIVLGLSTFNTVPPRHTHMVAIIPALMILTAMGIQAIANAFASMHNKLFDQNLLILVVLLNLTTVGGLQDFFIRMPPRYFPQPDQVVLWTGLDTNDESLVYIYLDPKENEYMPRKVSPFREEVAIETLSVEDLHNHRKVFSSDIPMIIFFPDEIREEIWQILTDQWGSSYTKRTFYSTNGSPVLAAGLNTPFIFERDKPFRSILKESYRHPSLVILLVSMAALFLVEAFFPKYWIDYLPHTIRKFSDWLNAPGLPAQPEE